MAIARQRPATANGVVFMLLEDELGQVNLIVPPPVYEQLPRARPRRAAAPRPRQARARGPQPERARQDARVARPARPRDRRRRRGASGASAGHTTSGTARRRAASLVEDVCAHDEREVRERLREVAEHAARRRVVLLGRGGRGRCAARGAASKSARASSRAADQREIGGVPERARQEHALARRQPVDLGVLLVGLVADDQPVASRACGRSPRPCRSPAGRPAAGSPTSGISSTLASSRFDPYDWTNAPSSGS